MSGISEPFIRRPVATTLLATGLFLAGATAFHELPISALPEVDYPTIVVSTFLPGASARTMVSSVTTPLERQFGQVPSLAQMTSVSSFGSSQITLQFDLDRNIDAAEQDVQAAINAASSLLPAVLPIPPTYSKSNPADAPILTLAVRSDTLPLSQVDDYADSILGQKIAQVAGVGLVSLNGGQKPAIRVQLDPLALAGAGLGPEDVRTALTQASVDLPKGSIDGPSLSYTLAANDQLYHAADFRSIIVTYRNGAPIRLDDIADVEDGVENTELAGWADGKPAVIMNVQRQPGANVIAVADRVKALLPQLEASLPNGIDVSILGDRTVTVRASVADVEFTLVLTTVLVVAVIFVFLRSFRATLIPGVAVPLALLGTFGAMDLLGYSLNNLSLMALTISTGFVIDDAIVMIENIARYIEQGEPPFEAALKGAKQIGFTIVSLTVSLVAVLIPLLFMGGIVGRLFREFAVTLGCAITISAILSLTLTAMMCAHVLRPEAEENHGRVYRLLERGFDSMLGVYDRGLRWVFAHQLGTLIVTLLTLAFTVLLVVIIPKGFFPQEDTGLLSGLTEAPPDTSFTRLTELQLAVTDILQKDPAVAHVASFVGSDGTTPASNAGRLSITLAPPSDRDGAAEVIARLKKKLARVAGIAVYLEPVQDLTLESSAGAAQYQYALSDPDSKELAIWAPRVLDALRPLPALTNVTAGTLAAGPGTRVDIDRDTASRLGVTSQLIDNTLYDAFGQRQVSTIFTQQNLYRVILGVKPEAARDPAALSRLYVTATGGTIPLGAFARFAPSASPLSVLHQGEFPAALLSFDVSKKASLGEAVDAIHGVEKKLRFPPGLRGELLGTARAFQTSLMGEPILVLAAVITVYIVLGVLYESYIHPITILSTLPSAGVGALLALIITGNSFGVIALIGIVLLIGIVKKNAIMMIDFALEAERDQHLPPLSAIHQACRLRFRPIMMTTAAALFGGIPLALGTGMGSELRRPLGIAIVGGLLVSQVLTLFTTPVIYLYMTRLGRWLTPHRKKVAP